MLIIPSLTVLAFHWAIGQSPTLHFALTPLQKLLDQLPYTGYQLTLHTDQGWHYQHHAWRKLLREGHIRQSMSHRATCLDNAACETGFSKLKAEIARILVIEVAMN